VSHNEASTTNVHIVVPSVLEWRYCNSKNSLNPRNLHDTRVGTNRRCIKTFNWKVSVKINPWEYTKRGQH